MKNEISRSSQHGVVLVICLIFLVLMTMFAVAVFGLGKSNLQIVGNMQQRSQVLNAANQAAEEALSSTRFFKTPGAVFVNFCNGDANTRCYDVNGSGNNDIAVTITPPPHCVVAQTIKNSSLDLSQSDDEGCALGASQTFGTAGTSTGDSLCAQTVWDINAVATDKTTQARATVTQGASVRVSTDAVASSCP